MSAPLPIVLASGSPRRRELLALTGLRSSILPTAINEERLPGEDPGTYVTRLSRDKALAALSLLDSEALIIAADTIVVDGNKVLGKPASSDEARTMLMALRGREHIVTTAVTLINGREANPLTDIATSPVMMRPYSADEVERYVGSGDPLDKAGGYGIQHEGFHPADGFAHCFANVMGFPLCLLGRMLRRLDITPEETIPAACQKALAYDCPVYDTFT